MPPDSIRDPPFHSKEHMDTIIRRISASRWAPGACVWGSLAWTQVAFADPQPLAPQYATDAPQESHPRVPLDDPTGGAYTSPTLLFTPAAALPVWNLRVTALSELQGPYQSADKQTPDAGARPGLTAEIGLPLGFTFAAGTNWVGGDVDPNTGNTKFSLGISPFFQARLHIYGDETGRGFQLGGAVTYKFVGFDGDPGEMEGSLSSQYRTRTWEAGLQGVVGKDFGSTDSDVELHAYGMFRIVPNLGVGAAAQGRYGVVIQPGETRYDTKGGGIVSWTIDRYQLGGLLGWSSLNLDQGHVGALAQVFASARL
jgi:hypothetical protein